MLNGAFGAIVSDSIIVVLVWQFALNKTKWYSELTQIPFLPYCRSMPFSAQNIISFFPLLPLLC